MDHKKDYTSELDKIINTLEPNEAIDLETQREADKIEDEKTQLVAKIVKEEKELEEAEAVRAEMEVILNAELEARKKFKRNCLDHK